MLDNMKGIDLKQTIKTFGFKEGFSFWLKWSFIDPIKIFYWKYIIGKPLCTYHGYFFCKTDCEHKKIYGRRNILKYSKELEKKVILESNTIRKGENGLCIYCGKEKGTELIDDPNWDTLEKWQVCETCKKGIEEQRGLSFGRILTINKNFDVRNLGLEIMKKSQKELDKISKETGKEFFNMELGNKKDV